FRDNRGPWVQWTFLVAAIGGCSVPINRGLRVNQKQHPAIAKGIGNRGYQSSAFPPFDSFACGYYVSLQVVRVQRGRS
ncbi:MAG: hypothetical protein U0V70_21165, partial [Terriglobia bacterium]